jgi:hypothetical protein
MSVLATETVVTFGGGTGGHDSCPVVDPGVIDCANQLDKCEYI